MKKILTLLVILITIFLVGSWFYFANTYQISSPSKSSGYFLEHLFRPHAKMKKETIGFLPYWRIDDSKYTRLDLVTEVNYFGLFVNGDGEFVKVVNGETNPGRREWESEKIKDLITKTHIFGSKFTLSIICQDNDDIESILSDETIQKKLITNITDEVKSRDLDGINIDFEYLGDVDKKFQPKFTVFSKNLKEELSRQSPNAKLELSVMPRSIRTKDIFDFTKLVPYYNNFIGMSYDFSGGSATNAGPIAPMTGFSENKYFFDVTTMYEDLGKYIPKEKTIMGVPHYGWDWTVEDGKKILSTTLLQTNPDSYAAVMSYARAKEEKNFKKSQCYFDDYAMEPWCWYTDPKTKIDHQVWFENAKSIGIKYDFANKKDLGGIAIWVLGYDKDYPDLWNLMKEKFSKNR